jgi:acetyl-CoA carboxylase biotin carboxyl carrier protein
MDVQEIRALIEIFERSSLSELVLERGGSRLTLRKEGARVYEGFSQGASAPPPSAPPSTVGDGYVIKAPLVGTFYRRPAPTEPPYVEVGDRVEKGDTVCIIEAMKVMNEIKAEHAGIVEKILVEEGKPVEYGQPLMVIRPV